MTSIPVGCPSISFQIPRPLSRHPMSRPRRRRKPPRCSTSAAGDRPTAWSWTYWCSVWAETKLSLSLNFAMFRRYAASIAPAAASASAVAGHRHEAQARPRWQQGGATALQAVGRFAMGKAAEISNLCNFNGRDDSFDLYISLGCSRNRLVLWPGISRAK